MVSRMFQPKQAGFLAVPSKEAAKLDWEPQMKLALAELEEDVSGFKVEIALLNKLRMDVHGAEANAAGLGIIYKYYMQIDSLTSRFPALQKPQNIQFEWCDAFDKDTTAKQSSLAFEKANLAFSLAALFSQVASSKALGGENFPRMGQNFQAAGNVFNWMTENFLHPPLTDLKPASLHYLSNLMFAQAQECAALKAIQEGKSAGIIAKLLFALETRYQRCSTLLHSPGAEEFRDALSHGCQVMSEGKKLYYAALAQYYKAEALASEEHHGEAIGRLEDAIDLIGRLIDLDYSTNMFDGGVFLEELEARKEKLEQENNFIYHENIVEVRLLPAINGVDLTKTASFKEVVQEFGLNQCTSEDIFKRVVPLRVLEEMSRYSEEKSKLVRYEAVKVHEADEDFELLSARLGSNIPKGKGHHFGELQRRLGAIEDMEPTRIQLEQHLKTAKIDLEQAGLLLHEDQQRSSTNSAKFGTSWTIQPLADEEYNALCKDVTLAEQSFQKLLQEHGEKVTSRLEDLLGRISSKLIGNTGSLLDGDQVGLEQTAASVLKDLNSLAMQRGVKLEALRQQIMEDDIADKLVHCKDVDALFEAELRKFDRACADIEAVAAEHWEKSKDLAGLLEQGERQEQAERSSLGLGELEHRCDDLLKSSRSILAQLRDLNGKTLRDRAAQLKSELTEQVQARKLQMEQQQTEIEESSAFQTQQLLRAKLSALSMETAARENAPVAPPSAAANERNSKKPPEPSLLD